MQESLAWTPRLLLLSAVLRGSPPNHATVAIATCLDKNVRLHVFLSRKFRAPPAITLPVRAEALVRSDHERSLDPCRAGPTAGESPVQKDAGTRQRPTARGPVGDRRACGADTSRLESSRARGGAVQTPPATTAAGWWTRRSTQRPAGLAPTRASAPDRGSATTDRCSSRSSERMAAPPLRRHTPPPTRAPRVGSVTSNQQPKCSSCRCGARAFRMQNVHWRLWVFSPVALGGSPRWPPHDLRREVPDKEDSTEGSATRWPRCSRWEVPAAREAGCATRAL